MSSKYNPLTGRYEEQADNIQGLGVDTGSTQTITENQLPGLQTGDIVQNVGGTVNGITSTAFKNPYLEYNSAPGLLGFTNGEWNNASQAAGLAGTTYNLYDNILGNKAQMYKTQMSAMKQNMANIAEDRANHAKFQGNFGGGFNSAFGSGLASTAVRV